MARLLKCKVCNGQVASDAKCCPHCGTPDYISDNDIAQPEDYTIVCRFSDAINTKTRIAIGSRSDLHGEPWKNVCDGLSSNCLFDGARGVYNWNIKLRPGIYSIYVSTPETIGVYVDGDPGPEKIASCSVGQIVIDSTKGHTIYVDVAEVKGCNEVSYSTRYSFEKTLIPAYSLHVKYGDLVWEYVPASSKKIRVDFIPKGTDGHGSRWGLGPSFFIDNERLHGREHYVSLKAGHHTAGVSFMGGSSPDSVEGFMVDQDTQSVSIYYKQSFWKSFTYVIHSISTR